MNQQVEEFIQDYIAALRNGSAAVFAGAGLSKATGFVDWKTLLRSIAHNIGLSIDKESDFVALTQYSINEHRGRYHINQLLVDEFSKKVAITENHKILASLPIKTFWTTNYDSLIEDALCQSGKTPDVKITQENLATNQDKCDAIVYKMHGDIGQPHDAVISKEDYENFNNKRPLFSAALQGDIVSKTFLFIGFSFSDPNIDYILSRIRVLLGQNQRNHYCFLRKIQRADYKNFKEFIYAQTRQNLQIKDLKR
ncbi:MAG: SIR2 family protein, partial [Candidatus Omnitrophota bacterium]